MILAPRPPFRLPAAPGHGALVQSGIISSDGPAIAGFPIPGVGIFIMIVAQGALFIDGMLEETSPGPVDARQKEQIAVFIALEGGEGAGKSTQAQLLVTRLQQEGRHATLVHEPGTTPDWANTCGNTSRASRKSPRRQNSSYSRRPEPS